MESEIEDVSLVSGPRGVCRDTGVSNGVVALPRDAELRVADAPVWLTRHLDPYDYWLKPGNVAR